MYVQHMCVCVHLYIINYCYTHTHNHTYNIYIYIHIWRVKHCIIVIMNRTRTHIAWQSTWAKSLSRSCKYDELRPLQHRLSPTTGSAHSWDLNMCATSIPPSQKHTASSSSSMIGHDRSFVVFWSLSHPDHPVTVAGQDRQRARLVAADVIKIIVSNLPQCCHVLRANARLESSPRCLGTSSHGSHQSDVLNECGIKYN